jgi:hypothetical protein
MGKIKLFYVLIVISACFIDCGLLERGYTDENGHYVPKRPRFVSSPFF